MSSRRFGSQSLVRLLGHWQQASSRTPLWRQLADALRLLILDGRLALNTRLPGERELAAALSVSRTTISSALAHLREEGYLESRHGSGSRAILPDSRAVPTLSTASAALDLYRRTQRGNRDPPGLRPRADGHHAESGADRVRSAWASGAA